MEAVLKVGGSLLKYPDKLRELCIEISILSREFNLLVIPGGGRFADVVREYYLKLNLSDEVSHWMAILAMDMYGFLLSELIPNSHIIFSLRDIYKSSEKGSLPILLPFKVIFEEDPLNHSWDVTSDSISAYIAGKIGAEKLILLKDVDGIYDNNGKLMEKVGLEQLMKINACVDKYLYRILREYGVKCYIINGLRPHRLRKFMKGLKIRATEIIIS